MKIEKFVLGLLYNNTYLVINEENNKCFLVDPSTPSSKLADYIKQNNLTLEGILITHGHFDHIGGASYFKQEFSAKIYMNKDDEDFIENPLKISRKFDKFAIDVYVKDGDTLNLCDKEIKVIATPGHSLGGVCYVMDDVIFCGDTIFRASYGRYDLRGGDFVTLKKSVEKILDIPGEYLLLSGHGEATCSSFERQNNPVFTD